MRVVVKFNDPMATDLRADAGDWNEPIASRFSDGVLQVAPRVFVPAHVVQSIEYEETTADTSGSVLSAAQ